MSRDPKSSYYDAGGIETLNIIKAKLTPEQYQGYLLGNVIKYACRANFKGCPERDSEKLAVYAKQHAESLGQADKMPVKSVKNSTHELKDINKEIDDALDLILKASGSSLKYCSNPLTLEKLRAAMLSVMKKSYIDGSNACHRVFESRHN